MASGSLYFKCCPIPDLKDPYWAQLAGVPQFPSRLVPRGSFPKSHGLERHAPSTKKTQTWAFSLNFGLEPLQLHGQRQIPLDAEALPFRHQVAKKASENQS